METKEKTKEKVYEVTFAGEVLEQIEKLQQKYDCTKEDILVNAINILEIYNEYSEKEHDYNQ